MLNSRTNNGVLKRTGFTLVELLVVITIIGILVGMLLPAVNSARESGRNVSCKNNLKQMGEACLAHEQTQEIFPTGGWGWYWVGDPDRGFGTQQPGGWIYNILPHTELTALHDQQFTVSGVNYSGKTPPTTNNTASLLPTGPSTSKQQAILQMVHTPTPFTNCPTRRRQALYPMNWGGSTLVGNNAGGTTAPQGWEVARTDYAVLVNNVAADEIGPGPAVGADYYDSSGSIAATAYAAQAAYFSPRSTTNSNISNYTGICFEQSTIRKDDVTDGLSQTILVGEKYLDSSAYGTGGVAADNENEYVGMDNDIGRTTYKPPMQDRWGLGDTFAFGSAHPIAANFVLCDGSVVSINYLVDGPTFEGLGIRSGRNTLLSAQLGSPNYSWNQANLGLQ